MNRHAIPQLGALGLFALAAGAAALPAFAQTGAAWPTKVIRVIVPFPPGGTSDILARLIGQKLTEAWGQQIVVDSRAGANGSIGTDLTVRAPAVVPQGTSPPVPNVRLVPESATTLPEVPEPASDIVRKGSGRHSTVPLAGAMLAVSL